MRNTALRQARVARGWSQQELAERLAVHRSTVIRWEYGIRPERFHREKLCDLFGVSATLLGFSPDPDDIKTSDTRRTSDPLWYQPYQRNPFFTGREEILQRLHENLKGHQAVPLPLTAALSGLGGIGKTQTAIEYAYRYGHEYSAVFWISAETYDMVASSFVGIADLLNLPEAQEQDQKKVIASVTRWLVNNNDWLLIFDNVEDLDLVKSILPSARSGSLLFTSRRQSLGFSAHRLNLEQMSLEEGMRFLLHRARMLEPTAPLDSFPFEERALVREIVTVLDGLPLPLDQAGAYIEATHCRFSDYLSLFHASPLRLLDERETSMDHPQSMVRTLKLAFEQVERSHPIAADLLMACAFLASEAIPEEFFLEGAPYLGPTLETLATDYLEFQSVMKTLFTYSFIQRDVGRKTITIHRLVQAILRGLLDSATHHAWISRVTQTITALFPPDEWQSDNFRRGERLFSHAMVCITYFDQEGKEEALFTPLMIKVADYLVKMKRLKEAEDLYHRALALRERAYGPDHPLLAEPLLGIADFSVEQGKYTEAEDLYHRALALRERAYGPDHPLLAFALDGLTQAYWRQSRFTEAESVALRSLTLRETALGPTHPLLGRTLNKLGNTYWLQGKFSEAEAAFRRVIQIWESLFGPDHPLLNMPLNGLASTYTEQGKYAEAEPWLQRAIAILETTFGPEYSELGYPLGNLANLYCYQGKYTEAELLYRRSIQIWERMVGSEHDQFALLLNNLAYTLFEQGKYDQVEPLLLRALEIWEKIVGLDHQMVTFGLMSLADLYREQGRYEEAKPLYERSLILRQRHLDPSHPQIANVLYQFGRFYAVQGQITEALPLYEQALTMHEQVFGPDHAKTQEVRAAYSSLVQRKSE